MFRRACRQERTTDAAVPTANCVQTTAILSFQYPRPFTTKHYLCEVPFKAGSFRYYLNRRRRHKQRRYNTSTPKTKATCSFEEG